MNFIPNCFSPLNSLKKSFNKTNSHIYFACTLGGVSIQPSCMPNRNCQRNSSVMMKTVCLILKGIIDNLTWFSFSGFMFSVIVFSSQLHFTLRKKRMFAPKSEKPNLNSPK